MNNFEVQQKEISDEKYLASIMNKMMSLERYVDVCSKAKEMGISTKEMISFVDDFYGEPNICNHEVSFDCNVFEYTYSNGVKDGVKCRMCNHKMKLETFDLAVKLGLGNKIIDINNSYLAAKFLYIFNDFICFRLTDRKLVLIHAKLSDHFHKCINCKCIMLHGNSEFFLDIFLLNIARFHKLILFNDLSCIT